MRKVIRIAVAAAVAALATVSLGSSHVFAACAGGPLGPAGSAPVSSTVAFVGTVTATDHNGRTATVHVEDIWRGGNLPAEVTVNGSPDLNAAATDVDRHYQVGSRYLFMPSGTGQPFDDNACSGTVQYTSAEAQQRPASARTVAAPLTVSSSTPGIAAAAAGILALVAVALALVWRARRTA